MGARPVVWCGGIAITMAFVGGSLAASQEVVGDPGQVVKTITAGGPPGAASEEGDAAAAKPKKSVLRPLPVRFQATVFQLDLAADKMSGLDARVLVGQAKTAQALEAALNGLGAARALYRVDQIVDLRTRSQLSIVSTVPVVSSTSTVGDRKTSSVERHSLGAKFNVQSALEPDDTLAGAIPLSINVEISALTDSGVEIGGAMAKVTRSITQTNGGTATLGKPLVLITADAAGDGATSRSIATAFVTLIELSADGQ